MKELLIARFREVYGRAPEFVAQAPGRIEFIGNHTDYNGGTVLGASINLGVWVGFARREDNQRRFFSDFHPKIVTVGTEAPVKKAGDESWLNYPLGVLAALPEFGLNVPGGFDYLAVSNLPSGAGLSSSAALELASALAFLASTGQDPTRETVVKIGKYAENNFVGVPCGILDQGVSGFGQKDHLVFIDCIGPRFATVPMPAGAHFWIFNTHTKHALVDGLYAERHRECMEAAKALGVKLLAESDLVSLDTRRSELSDLSFRRAKHVLEEIERVDQTQEALRVGDLKRVGQLLTASHRSSQEQFENSTEELDTLVDQLTATPHVFGARLTGGGFGGAVMALTSGEFSDVQASAVKRAYAARYGSEPQVLHCQTGDGAQLVQG